MRARKLMVALVLVVSAGAAQAADWSSLSAEQQRVLANYQSRWSELNTTQQERLAEGSQHQQNPAARGSGDRQQGARQPRASRQ